MGNLYYGSNEFSIAVEDRALAHLQVIIVAKLRRNESFQFAWENDATPGHGGVWMSPSIPLRFEFVESGRPLLTPEWAAKLAETVNRTGTLRLVPEPVAPSKPE